jgi:transposase-like protein
MSDRRSGVAEVEVMARVERRRIWTDAERASLLAELDVPGSSVPMVARRHGIAPSLLYGWRAARKAKMGVAPESMEFMPLGVFGHAEDEGPAMIAAPMSVTPEPSKPAPSRVSSMDECQSAGNAAPVHNGSRKLPRYASLDELAAEANETSGPRDRRPASDSQTDSCNARQTPNDANQAAAARSLRYRATSSPR